MEKIVTEYNFVTPKDWRNVRCLKMVGLFIDMGNEVKPLREYTNFENEKQYDDFVEQHSRSLANSDAFLKYDVQIKEPNGVLISYPFEIFKKLIF